LLHGLDHGSIEVGSKAELRILADTVAQMDVVPRTHAAKTPGHGGGLQQALRRVIKNGSSAESVGESGF
jgi:hypothetical protein